MTASLRIIVADDEPDMLDYFRRILAMFGHQVVAETDNGEQLVEQCRTHQPDLVISDICMPDQDGIEAIVEIWRDAPLPVVLVTGLNAPDHIRDALRETVLAYLTKPFKKAELQDAIARAIQRFAEFQALLDIHGDRRQAIRDRKVLDSAKGMLMMKKRLTEPAAFRRMQQLAAEKDLNILQIARTIIDEHQTIEHRELEKEQS